MFSLDDASDFVVINDYELALIDLSVDFSMFNHKVYSIALQRKGYCCFGYQNQNKKIIPKSIKIVGFKEELKETLDRWISEYCWVYFGSYNAKKNKIYHKFLSKLGYELDLDEVISHYAGNIDVYLIKNNL